MRKTWVCFELRDVKTRDAYVGVVDAQNLYGYVKRLCTRKLPGFSLVETSLRVIGEARCKDDVVGTKVERLVELRKRATTSKFIVLNSRRDHHGKMDDRRMAERLGDVVKQELS